MSEVRNIKLPHVIKEGIIHKEGHNIRKMKKRHFKLLIDLDCIPVLEYYDDLDIDRPLGKCNLSASTMNKPKNSRPPFVHCLRIDLIDHAMNSYVKLVLGWETQSDMDEWIQAFKTASQLITAYRQGTLGVKLPQPQVSESSSGQVRTSTTQVAPAQSVTTAVAAVSSPATAHASATHEDASSSPGGTAKAYQRRGSITVGNTAAAEKREQEKADAEAEKQALLEKASTLASIDIEKLIAETARNLEVISGEERFNPRKQTLEEVLPALKVKHDQALKAEKLVEEKISSMQAAFEGEMKTFTTDASLPSHQRCEIQSRLGLYLSRVEGEFHNVTASSSAPTKIIQAYERNIKAIKARVIDLEEFEQSMQAMLTSTITAKTQLLSTMLACSLPVVLQLKSHYDELFSKETNPDIRGVLAECLSICTQKIEAEESLDKEAAQFVEIGANLRKYARDKLIKKSKHEPVQSVVKCASGTLIWGSHKTGPKILHVATGPSELLAGSGILGQRSVNLYYIRAQVACSNFLLAHLSVLAVPIQICIFTCRSRTVRRMLEEEKP
jgi:hypothetical protein